MGQFCPQFRIRASPMQREKVDRPENVRGERQDTPFPKFHDPIRNEKIWWEAFGPIRVVGHCCSRSFEATASMVLIHISELLPMSNKTSVANQGKPRKFVGNVIGNGKMQYFCEDRANGERHVYDLLEEALEDARISLKEYRKSANENFEWDMSVEDLTVGIVADSGDPDDDIVTHRTRYVPMEEDSFDVEIVALAQEKAA